ncbi:hypothetical protein WG904_03445 [Pedobacter sp. Du54]|uniref:hypothetical protein n=1 Tax=Pedobacter anseongensis TaxID=3133439 RepID=UPI003096A21F
MRRLLIGFLLISIIYSCKKKEENISGDLNVRISEFNDNTKINIYITDQNNTVVVNAKNVGNNDVVNTAIVNKGDILQISIQTNLKKGTSLNEANGRVTFLYNNKIINDFKSNFGLIGEWPVFPQIINSLIVSVSYRI